MSSRKLQDYALVIGVSRYVDRDQWDTLEGSPVDCLDFEDWLKSAAGLDPNNICRATWSPDSPMPFPHRSAIENAALDLLWPSQRKRCRGGRRLYVFCAGHCLGTGTTEADVVTADARPGWAASFPLTIAAGRIRDSGLFREVIVMIDGCRLVMNSASQPVLWELDEGPYVGNTAYCCAFATLHARPAYEKSIGGKTRGVFSHALLEGLRGKARDSQGHITTRSLEAYLQERIPELRPPNTDQEAEIYCPTPLRIL
jgi:uncharacterized caspase-like protein